MKWMKERDLFLAQTMAFVQSVTGKKAAAEARAALIEPTPIESTPIESTPVDKIEKLAWPVETLPIETLQIETSKVETPQITGPSPVRLNDVRQEIRGRVAAFRAHQELFHRERDKYYNSVLSRFRAPTGPAPGADDQPSKP